jgi:hypothetical protein
MNLITSPLESEFLREPWWNAPALRNPRAAQAPDRFDVPMAPESRTTAGCTATRAITSRPGTGPYPNELVARREALLTRYGDLVTRIADHLFRGRRYVDVEDLIGAGRIGLLRAIREYGLEKARTFELHADARIREAMLEFVRDSAWTLRAVRGPLRRIDDDVTACS